MNENNENKRELSEAEKKRSIVFEKAKEKLAAEGYEEKDLTVGAVYANIMALVLGLPFAVFFGVLFLILNPVDFRNIIPDSAFGLALILIVFIAAMAVLTVVHELIHGITWSFFTEKHWKSIAFGFIAKDFMPYCTCSEALTKTRYILGSFMPTLVLGIIPSVIAIFTGSLSLLLVGILMIFAGGGDLTVIMKILSFKAPGKEILYMDHPYEIGLVAFIK